MRSGVPKLDFTGSEREALALNQISVAIKTDKYEVTIIRDQHLSIAAQIATHLFAFSKGVDVFSGRLDLNASARRKLAFDQFTFSSLLKLIGSKETPVGKTGAPVRN